MCHRKGAWAGLGWAGPLLETDLFQMKWGRGQGKQLGLLVALRAQRLSLSLGKKALSVGILSLRLKASSRKPFSILPG